MPILKSFRRLLGRMKGSAGSGLGGLKRGAGPDSAHAVDGNIVIVAGGGPLRIARRHANPDEFLGRDLAVGAAFDIAGQLDARVSMSRKSPR